MGRVNIILEEDVHRQAKSVSALKGTTLVECINEAIREKVKRLG